jgi:hypothetical protein
MDRQEILKMIYDVSPEHPSGEILASFWMKQKTRKGKSITESFLEWKAETSGAEVGL